MCLRTLKITGYHVYETSSSRLPIPEYSGSHYTKIYLFTSPPTTKPSMEQHQRNPARS